jgi:hypothetical protein
VSSHAEAIWVAASSGSIGLVITVAANVDVIARRIGLLPESADDQDGSDTSDVGTMARRAELGRGLDLPIRTWALSPERDTYVARRGRSYASSIGAGFFAFGGGYLLAAYASDAPASATSQARAWGIAALSLAVIVAAYSAMPYLSARSAFRQRRQATAAARVDAAIEEASDANLQRRFLFVLNRRQLDEYQLITRKQQRSAFMLAQAATVLAFLVLVAGIVVALAAHGTVNKSIAGGLSGLGATLSTFLANTFFKSHQSANKEMSRYYLEPQRTGRLLAAERIVADTEITDENLRAAMVDKVLSWEMPTRQKAADNPSPKDAG